MPSTCSNRFTAIRLAYAILLAAAVCEPATGLSSHALATFKAWLARLRALINQKVSCFFLKGHHNVLRSENIVAKWAGKAEPSKDWKDYHSTNVRGVRLSAEYSGVVISSFNAHVQGSVGGEFHARLVFDNVAPFDDDWGAYYLHFITGYRWLPLNLVQMSSAQCGRPSSAINVRLQTKSAGFKVYSAALEAVLLPPPAFLNSIRMSSISAKSGQAPVANFVHNIKVSAKKALLIMAANGRIKSAAGQSETSLTYTVDGHSPTRQHARDYGYYHVTKDAVANSYVRVGFYQLAEVSTGTHKIQLDSKGQQFDLQYATSQVAVVPVDTVQLQTRTADWTMNVKKNQYTVLLSAPIIASEDSVLVLAASFEISSKTDCGQLYSFLQFRIDGKVSHPTSWKPKISHFSYFISLVKARYFYPGSLLQFVKVKRGSHRVDLYTSRFHCPAMVQRLALQVGVMPQSF